MFQENLHTFKCFKEKNLQCGIELIVLKTHDDIKAWKQLLTHRGQDKMAANSLTTFSNAFLQ